MYAKYRSFILLGIIIPFLFFNLNSYKLITSLFISEFGILLPFFIENFNKKFSTNILLGYLIGLAFNLISPFYGMIFLCGFVGNIILQIIHNNDVYILYPGFKFKLSLNLINSEKKELILSVVLLLIIFAEAILI